MKSRMCPSERRVSFALGFILAAIGSIGAAIKVAELWFVPFGIAIAGFAICGATAMDRAFDEDYQSPPPR